MPIVRRETEDNGPMGSVVDYVKVDKARPGETIYHGDFVFQCTKGGDHGDTAFQVYKPVGEVTSSTYVAANAEVFTKTSARKIVRRTIADEKSSDDPKGYVATDNPKHGETVYYGTFTSRVIGGDHGQDATTVYDPVGEVTSESFQGDVETF